VKTSCVKTMATIQSALSTCLHSSARTVMTSLLTDSPRGFMLFPRTSFAASLRQRPDMLSRNCPLTTALPEFGDSETSGSSVLSFHAAVRRILRAASVSPGGTSTTLSRLLNRRCPPVTMEKENKKLRDSACRERTEGVLCACVLLPAPGDKRYLLILVETRRLASRGRLQAQRKAALLERQRAAAEARAALAEEHARETAARELAVRASVRIGLLTTTATVLNARRSGGGRNARLSEAARQVPGSELFALNLPLLLLETLARTTT